MPGLLTVVVLVYLMSSFQIIIAVYILLFVVVLVNTILFPSYIVYFLQYCLQVAYQTCFSGIDQQNIAPVRFRCRTLL